MAILRRRDRKHRHLLRCVDCAEARERDDALVREFDIENYQSALSKTKEPRLDPLPGTTSLSTDTAIRNYVVLKMTAADHVRRYGARWMPGSQEVWILEADEPGKLLVKRLCAGLDEITKADIERIVRFEQFLLAGGDGA